MPISIDKLPVIPLKHGTKQPLLKSWQKLAPTDLSTYGTRDPTKNWSIRCDDIVVIDVDAKPTNASKACMDMESFRDQIFNIDTYVVRTRTGNPHAYFLYDRQQMAHWKKRVGIYGFVDVCVGRSSLVVAAGSVVDGVTYTVHCAAELSTMPDWLFHKIDAEMRRCDIDEDRRKECCMNDVIPVENAGTAAPAVRHSSCFSESPAELEALLLNHGYQDPCIRANRYGCYDIVFGHPHKCPITNLHHEQIDGFLFKKTSDNTIMAGCYSERCRGRFKRISRDEPYQQPPELARLIDHAAEKCMHYSIAMVAAHLYRETIKYVGSEGWFIFNHDNGLWKQDRHGDRMRTLLSTSVSDEFARRIMYYNEKQREATSEAESKMYDDCYTRLNAVMTKLGDGYHKDKLIKEAQALMRDDDFLDKLDDGPLIGFDDGVYDFRTMTFRVGQPEDYVSLSVGYRFPVSDDVAPDVLDEVRQVFRDPFESEAMMEYTLRTLASSMDGRRAVAEFYVWTGAGSNGKSTIQELVMATMGKYAQPLDVTFWTRAKGTAGSAMPELADKRACRYVFSNEPEASDKLQVAKLKEATGGEKITARKLYSDPITYRPKFGIFILANTLPELSKIDGGISRRLRVVPFIHQFKQFPLPGQRLAKPAVMENCRNNIEWRRALMRLLIDEYASIKGMTAIPFPEEVKQASEDYLEDNNPVGRFLADNYVITGNDANFIRASELYNSYIGVTKDKTMSITAFGTSMTHINNVPKKKKKLEGAVVWCYFGIKAVGAS